MASEPFDPYHDWLGIPPQEQPANYYRLLGLALFESNPKVIEHAADRQMAHVRQFQGKHPAEASQVLNNLSRARLALLTEKKHEYDQTLQRQETLPPGPLEIDGRGWYVRLESDVDGPCTAHRLQELVKVGQAEGRGLSRTRLIAAALLLSFFPVGLFLFIVVNSGSRDEHPTLRADQQVSSIGAGEEKERIAGGASAASGPTGQELTGSFKAQQAPEIPTADPATANGSAPEILTRGETRLENRDYDGAIEDFSEAVRLNPNFIAAYIHRGEAWHAKGQFDLAINDYSRAIQLDPYLAQAYHQRAWAFFQSENFARAIQDVDEAIRLGLGDAQTMSLAYYVRGSARFQQAELNLALADFNEAIRVDPSNGEACHARGVVKRETGDRMGAESDFARARQLGY